MNNVKPIRLRLGLTQHSFAGLIGCTQSAVAQIERHETEPSIATAKKIIAAAKKAGLHLTLDSVYGLKDLPKGMREPANA